MYINTTFVSDVDKLYVFSFSFFVILPCVPVLHKFALLAQQIFLPALWSPWGVKSESAALILTPRIITAFTTAATAPFPNQKETHSHPLTLLCYAPKNLK